VHLTRRIGSQPVGLSLFQMIGVQKLAALGYDIVIAAGQRDQRAPVIVPVQRQRLFRHHDRLPHLQMLALERPNDWPLMIQAD
jgi:hypothetical protein